MATLQEKEFIAACIDDELLDRAVSWIDDNMEVDDVFNEPKILEFINKNYEPEDVFPINVLEKWATQNGFVPEE